MSLHSMPALYFTILERSKCSHEKDISCRPLIVLKTNTTFYSPILLLLDVYQWARAGDLCGWCVIGFNGDMWMIWVTVQEKQKLFTVKYTLSLKVFASPYRWHVCYKQRMLNSRIEVRLYNYNRSLEVMRPLQYMFPNANKISRSLLQRNCRKYLFLIWCLYANFI